MARSTPDTQPWRVAHVLSSRPSCVRRRCPVLSYSKAVGVYLSMGREPCPHLFPKRRLWVSARNQPTSLRMGSSLFQCISRSEGETITNSTFFVGMDKEHIRKVPALALWRRWSHWKKPRRSIPPLTVTKWVCCIKRIPSRLGDLEFTRLKLWPDGKKACTIATA